MQQLAANAVTVSGNGWLPTYSYCSIQQIGHPLSTDHAATKDSSGLNHVVKGMMASWGTSTFRITPVTARIYQLPSYKLHMDNQI